MTTLSAANVSLIAVMRISAGPLMAPPRGHERLTQRSACATNRATRGEPRARRCPGEPFRMRRYPEPA